MKKILLILSVAGLQLINCSEQINQKSVEQKLTKEEQEEVLQSQANEKFLDAAQKGNLQKAQKALRAGANVDAKDKYDQTALMLASHCGLTDLVGLLIKAGANVNAKYKDGCTALTWASMNFNTDIVELLIKAGADINAKDNYVETALMYASVWGHKDIVELLTIWAPYSKEYYDDMATRFNEYKKQVEKIESELKEYLYTDLVKLTTEYLVSSKTNPSFQDWMEIVHSGEKILDEFNSLGNKASESVSTSSSSSSSCSSSSMPSSSSSSK